ncbi:glycine-rich cell wall structural protein 1.8-like [Dendronephthya gigantea]|uniref:glycine-rich cell wall structural protein 1.8-like n=1 Tax=Dendronephthya gigantea TaxID=151771 RepID=UPI001069575B|nr:glycine-rich cell wall structural protein 1.8-like [Dendronephthya gigantea]
MTENEIFFIEGCRLINHVVGELHTANILECSLNCLRKSPVCKAINYSENKQQSNLPNCQLINATETTHPQNLLLDKDYDFYEKLEKEVHNKDEVTPSYNATFTNLGATGRFGPTSLGSYYVGKDNEKMVTVQNGTQFWTVPYDGTYEITAVGAAGGYDIFGPTSTPGRGAYIKGEFQLNKGDVLKILIGQRGVKNTERYSAGGGGGTFVATASNTPLIIAGGGGGTQSLKTRLLNCDASTSRSGNKNACIGQCIIQSGGSNGTGSRKTGHSKSGGGGGGFQSNGHSGSYFDGSFGEGGEGGRGFLQGGAGGRSLVRDNAPGGFGGGGGAWGWNGGAGGGGGYSGGASGDNKEGSCGGGGGSFNGGKNRFHKAGYLASGHGFVRIKHLSHRFS